MFSDSCPMCMDRTGAGAGAAAATAAGVMLAGVTPTGAAAALMMPAAAVFTSCMPEVMPRAKPSATDRPEYSTQPRPENGPTFAGLKGNNDLMRLRMSTAVFHKSPNLDQRPSISPWMIDRPLFHSRPPRFPSEETIWPGSARAIASTLLTPSITALRIRFQVSTTVLRALSHADDHADRIAFSALEIVDRMLSITLETVLRMLSQVEDT